MPLAAADQSSIRCTFGDQSPAAAGCPSAASNSSDATKTLYIAIGAGGGGFLLLVIIVGAIIRRRKDAQGTGQKDGPGARKTTAAGVLKMMDDDEFHRIPADHLF